jgi:hypothetical protein
MAMCMKILATVGLFAVLAALPVNGQQANGTSSPPLMIEKQGSFFVGGTTRHTNALSGVEAEAGITQEGDITTGQMYVQYQIPVGAKHLPVVMIHGCCLSGESYETTPDG